MKKILIVLLLSFVYIFNVEASDYVDYSSNDLTIATFFTKDYYKSGDGVDTRIGLYDTSNGSDFVYMGETGLTGRDARIMYINGVFYMATTKGASDSGGFVFNVFKSTDLINWTNDVTFPYVHRYDVGVSPYNKYGLPANNWGPKWMVDGEKVYLTISSTRFDKDGAKYYYIKPNELSENGVQYDPNLSFDSSKGVLVKESAVLDSNGRAQYVIGDNVYYTRDDNNNIYNMNNEKLEYDGVGKYTDNSNNCIIDVRNSNKLTCNDSKVGNLKIKTKREIVLLNNEIQQIKCPWYNYSIFDIFVSEVELGSLENQKDINYQNLNFKQFKKVNLKGYSYDTDSNDNFNGYAFRHGTLAGPIIRNDSNTGYKYAMYLKSDPYGTVQRWLSNSIDGEWVQIDDRFYPKAYQTISDGSFVISDPYDHNADSRYVCKSVSKVVKHDERAKNEKDTSQKLYLDVIGDSTYGISKHFEGSFFETFNGETYFYSDHYDASTEVAADDSSDDELTKKNKHYGIHYSVLSPNSSNNSVDFTDATDHIRFNIFHALNIYNTSMRPSDLVNSSVRNGGIFRAESEQMEQFKNIVLNASKFNLSYTLYSTNDDNKVIAVVKSNRAINNDNNQESSINGWKDIKQLSNDQDAKNLNQDLVNNFAKYDESVPYTSKELYLYKIMDKNVVESLNVTDRNGNHMNISINTNDDAQDVDIEVDPEEKSDEMDIIDYDGIDDEDEIDNDSKDNVQDVDVDNTLNNFSIVLLIFGIAFIVSGLVLFPFVLKKKND